MAFTLQEHGVHSFSSVTALETQLSHFYALRGPLALGREDVLESDPQNSFGGTHILATVAVPLLVAPFPAPHVAIPSNPLPLLGGVVFPGNLPICVTLPQAVPARYFRKGLRVSGSGAWVVGGPPSWVMGVLNIPYTNCSPFSVFVCPSVLLSTDPGVLIPEAFSQFSGVNSLAFDCFLSLQDIGFQHFPL